MINLIRMNLIRMFQMKCIYILLLVCLGIGFIFVTESQDTSTDEMEQQMIAEQQEKDSQEPNGSQVGITVDTSKEDSTISWFTSEFVSSGFMVVLVGIFMSILACSEHDSGFLKNLASCSQHKWQIVVARLIPGFLCSVILQIAVFVSIMGVNVLYGSPLQIGNVKQLLLAGSIQVLLHSAISAFVLTIAELSRSLLVCTLVSIFTGFGFAGLIVAFVSQKLTQYMILCRIQMTALPLDHAMLPTTIVVGVTALIVYMVLSSVIFQKRDTY